MRVVFHRPPMVERENLAGALAEALAVPRIHLGDLVRTHISQRTEPGIRAADMSSSGMLLSDGLLAEIVGDRMSRTAPTGFLLDGYPVQPGPGARAGRRPAELGTPLDGALTLRLSESERVRYLRHRTALHLCAADPTHRFHPETDTVPDDGICIICGGALYQRDDEDHVRRLVGEHEARLELVAQYYAQQHLLLELDASGTSAEVTSRAVGALRERRR